MGPRAECAAREPYPLYSDSDVKKPASSQSRCPDCIRRNCAFVLPTLHSSLMPLETCFCAPGKRTGDRTLSRDSP